MTDINKEYEKEYYDEYRNSYYNPDDDDAEPGINLNWKRIQRGFHRAAGNDQETAETLSGVQANLETLNTDVETLKTDVEEIKTAVDDLNTAVEAAEQAAEAAAASEAAAEAAQAAAEAVEESIPSDYSELSDDVDNMKSQLIKIVPLPLTGWIDGYYIQCATSTTVGDTVSLTPATSSNMSYMSIDVAAGDTFIATGRATGDFRGWFQVDASNNFVQGSGVIYTDDKIEITTPGKLILNANRNNVYSAYEGTNKIAELENENAEIKSRIAYDEKTTEIITGNERIDFTDGGYVGASNITPPTPNISVNADYSYAFDTCMPGDTYNIKGKYGYSTSIRGWLFFDSSGTRIVNGSYNVQYTDWHQVFAPDNAAYVAFNAIKSVDHIIIKNQLILDKIDGKPANLTGLSWEAGYITVNGSESGGNNYKRTSAFLVKAGQTLTIKAEMRVASGSLLSRWSENGTFIESLISGEVAADVTKTWTAEVDSYVRISIYSTGAETFKIHSLTPIETGKAISELAAKTDSLMYEWERILNSVCCIGDSLTRGAYYVDGHDGSAIDQNYPYFFAKQTGLAVQNEGYSGSSPSSRWSYFSTFDFTPYNAFFIWWGTNGGLTDTLEEDGVIDGNGDLIADYTQYEDTNTGDYCKVIGRIISLVPHAKIFLATVYTTSGSVDTTNAVIKKIADLYPDNVMGIVECNDGTLYPLTSRNLTPSWVHIDNITHFSMVGNYYLAVHWIKAVRAIIAINPGQFEDIMEDILT